MSRLFSRQRVGVIQTGMNVVTGAIEIGKFLADVVRSWRTPKRAEDVFADGLEVERVRAEGMSTVYRSEPPPRGANAPREDLP